MAVSKSALVFTTKPNTELHEFREELLRTWCGWVGVQQEAEDAAWGVHRWGGESDWLRRVSGEVIHRLNNKVVL